MSSFLNKFPVFRFLPQKLRLKIKLFHVFHVCHAYCVTIDDEVYGVGDDICHRLGYNQWKDNDECYVLIRELCYENIVEFFGNDGKFFAKTQSNNIFYWCTENKRHCHELNVCFKRISYNYIKEINQEPFNGKSLINICWGHNHYLALTSDGQVFGWGDNDKGQISPNIKENHIETPVSMTQPGQVIIAIQCARDTSYALTKSKDLYIFNREEYLRFHMKFNNKICDFSTKCDFLIQIDNGEIYISKVENQKVVFQPTGHKNIFEYRLFREQLTYKTVYIEGMEIFCLGHIFNEQLNKFEDNLSKIDFDESELLENTNFLSDLPQTLKTDVKCFYRASFYEFIVMNNDQVFIKPFTSESFDYGVTGLGSDEAIRGITEITQLSGKNIEEFYESNFFMFARSKTNEIYSWGMNDQGQLGRGFISDRNDYIKPGQCESLSGKSIIKITSGLYHCLALTSGGIVYGWGSNEHGQLGCGKVNDKCISGPIVVKLETDIPIKYIHCKGCSSFAVNNEGNAYFWGENPIGENHWWPQIINIEKVLKIHKLFEKNKCLVLTEMGDIFVHCLNENVSLKRFVFDETRITDISDGYNIIFLESEQFVYEFEQSAEYPRKTTCMNLFETFFQIYNTSYKTLQVMTEQNNGEFVKYLTTKQIEVNPVYNHQNSQHFLILKDKNIFEGKLQKYFSIVSVIGSGAYGKVYKVEDKLHGDFYAVKSVEMEDKWKYNLSEINIMSELKSDFMVQYFDSWIDIDFNSKYELSKFLFIKMELCCGNLRKVINNLKKIHRNFQNFKFYISCELFKALTVCVSYLHSIHVIHRDLKPENVVTTDGTNGVFLKLCDFNIAKVLGIKDEFEIDQDSASTSKGHTRKIGTMYYFAPEVKTGKYDQKSDIFGLALIATEIFNFEDSVNKISSKCRRNMKWDKYLSTYEKTDLKNNFSKLLETLKDCLQPKDQKPENRPNCEELIQRINDFSLNKSFVRNHENYSQFLTILENDFLMKFFESKTKE